MKADFTRCACSRINDPWRKFCGGCGRKLEPGCGGCGFVNARSDHFCGGCGDKVLVSRVVRATDEPSTIPIDIIEVVS